MAELSSHIPPVRTPDEIAKDGGSDPGKPIQITPPRSGEEAIKEWEKDHGNIDEPAYVRKERKKQTGEI